MFTAVLWTLFVSGIIAGRLFKACRQVRFIGNFTMPTVLLLLFLFGSEIGSDDMIMQSLPDLGVQATVIAVACVGGSVLFSGAVYGLIKNRIRQKK